MASMLALLIVWVALLLPGGAAQARPAVVAATVSREAPAKEAVGKRSPLFVGGATLAAWAAAVPELFARPDVEVVALPQGDFAAHLPALRARIASRRFQVLHLQPDHQTGDARQLAATRVAMATLARAARQAGMRVVLARPLAFSAEVSGHDEVLARWMKEVALAEGYQYADYNHIDFHPELKLRQPADLPLATNTLRGALDAAFSAVPGVSAAQRRQAADERNDAIPDGPGSGPFPALHGLDPAVPGYVLYRPANLALFEHQPLPVLLFANGGCMADANSSRRLLTEVASRGYLVMVPGQMISGPGGLKAYPGKVQVPPQLPGQGVSSADLRRAMDWVTAQARSETGWGRYVDASRIAVAGWSCGGLLAIDASRDPRVKATIVFNSGLFPSSEAGMPGLDIRKEALATLHAPILYVLGGITDVAFGNGSDDFSRIHHVPAVLLSRDVGHSGTFWEPDGGVWAQVAWRWLDWHLRADLAAARDFVGETCGLCRDPSWSVQRNRWVSAP